MNTLTEYRLIKILKVTGVKSIRINRIVVYNVPLEGFNFKQPTFSKVTLYFSENFENGSIYLNTTFFFCFSSLQEGYRLLFFLLKKRRVISSGRDRFVSSVC